MNEEEVDWHWVVQTLADIDEDSPVPEEIDPVTLWVTMVGMAKIVVRLERQLEVLTDNIRWEEM